MVKNRTVLSVLLVLLSLTFAWADEPVLIAWMNMAIKGGGVAVAAPSCSEASNEVNSARDTIQANDRTVGMDAAWMFSATADCSGGLKTAYLYEVNSGAGVTAKLCVYSYDGSGDPAAGDTLVACSGTISSAGSNGWRTASFSGGNVTASGNYWVMVVNASTGNTWTAKGGTSTLYYKTATGYYASPPANTGTGWNSIGFGPLSAYVTIGASW